MPLFDELPPENGFSHHEPTQHGRDARKIVGQFLVTGAKSEGE